MSKFESIARAHGQAGYTNPADLCREAEWQLTREYLATLGVDGLKQIMRRLPDTALVSLITPCTDAETVYEDIRDGLMQACRPTIATILEAWAPPYADRWMA